MQITNVIVVVAYSKFTIYPTIKESESACLYTQGLTYFKGTNTHETLLLVSTNQELISSVQNIKLIIIMIVVISNMLAM